YLLKVCANFKTYLAIFDGSLSIHALLIIGGNSSNIFITSQLYVSFSPAGLNESTFALLITEQALAYVYRSEEHTSELQSRFDIVCRLLLEEKNDQDTDASDI